MSLKYYIEIRNDIIVNMWWDARGQMHKLIGYKIRFF